MNIMCREDWTSAWEKMGIDKFYALIGSTYRSNSLIIPLSIPEVGFTGFLCYGHFIEFSSI